MSWLWVSADTEALKCHIRSHFESEGNVTDRQPSWQHNSRKASDPVTSQETASWYILLDLKKSPLSARFIESVIACFPSVVFVSYYGKSERKITQSSDDCEFMTLAQ